MAIKRVRAWMTGDNGARPYVVLYDFKNAEQDDAAEFKRAINYGMFAEVELISGLPAELGMLLRLENVERFVILQTYDMPPGDVVQYYLKSLQERYGKTVVRERCDVYLAGIIFEDRPDARPL